MNPFDYAFMQRALFVGFLVALIAPLIGRIIVLRRLSMVGDAIAHTTLAGVAIGLILGLDPLISAMGASLAGIFLVDLLRKRLPRYADVAVAILMALGIGLAGTLSSFVIDANRFNAFLFGSIVAISPEEVRLISLITVGVLVTHFLFAKEFFAITFDEEGARHSGVAVKRINLLFMIMLALTLSIAAKTVGSLILSSLLVLPVACALQVSSSYKGTLLWGIAFSLFFMLGGLLISFYSAVKPGGAVVLLAVLTYFAILPLKRSNA